MKIKRHSKIIELVKNNVIETQEELAEYLKQSGYSVTQATVSRDIRELKLTKVSSEDGTQRYDIFESRSDANINEKFIRVFKEGVKTIDFTQNFIVLKTLEGMAMAVAACIDSMNYREILGCIAGDDTIFCAVKTEEDVSKIIIKFKEIINLK